MNIITRRALMFAIMFCRLLPRRLRNLRIRAPGGKPFGKSRKRRDKY